MKQYIVIYKKLLQLNFAMLVAYRANFINSIISTIGWGLFSIISIFLLTSRSSSLYGWTRAELLFLTAGYNIIIGFFHMLFSRNFERFSQIIHFGQLDNILVKPKDSQFLLSFWLVNYTSIFRVLLGVIFVFYLSSSVNINFSFLTIVSFLILSIAGIALLYSVWFMISTLMIWFTSLSNLIDLLYDLNGLTRYPAEMYRGVGQFLLFFLFPFTLMVVLPVKVLLQKILPGEALLLLCVSFLFVLLSRFFWRFALRYYTSASS